MIEVGRVCFKIAGREAGKLGVIIEVIDKNYILLDGLVRRKKCNIAHIVPLSTVLKIKKGAATADVQKAMIDAKIISEVPKKGEKKEKKAKPVKQHLMREKSESPKKAEPAKKEEKKPEHKAAKKEKAKPAKKEAKKKEAKPAKKEKAKKK